MSNSSSTDVRVNVTMNTTQSEEHLEANYTVADPIATTRSPAIPDDKLTYMEMETKYMESFLQNLEPSVHMYDSLTFMSDGERDVLDSDMKNVSGNWCIRIPQLGRYEVTSQMFQVRG